MSSKTISGLKDMILATDGPKKIEWVTAGGSNKWEKIKMLGQALNNHDIHLEYIDGLYDELGVIHIYSRLFDGMAFGHDQYVTYVLYKYGDMLEYQGIPMIQ